MEADSAWRENADMVTIALREQLTEAEEELETLKATVEGLRQDLCESLSEKHRNPGSSGPRVHFRPSAPEGEEGPEVATSSSHVTAPPI